VLSVGWDTIRLFLHVLAATIWVGGQITLADGDTAAGALIGHRHSADSPPPQR
jgi:hypothetical protein